MIGELKPYQIRYKSLKPNFKIDAKTFTLLPQLDVLNRENENPDPNRLLIDRKTFTARTVLNDSEECLFNHLLTETDLKTDMGKKRAGTIPKK